MSQKLKKGIYYVFLANIINMILSLITNFLLPKFLSIDSYSAIKTFQLYITYVGVFHLGFVDGIYLKYGGKELEKIDPYKLQLNLSTLRFFQLFFSVLFSIISIIVKDKILLAFSFSIISLNVISYFKMLYQAVGEFKKYSKLTNISTALTFLINMMLLFVIKTDNYFIYLICYSIVNFIVWIAMESSFRKKYTVEKQTIIFSFKSLISNIKSGFSLMCGNFSSFLLTGMDRWFVKVLQDNYAFAKYSFAVSIENMLNVAITAITIPLYNYFCNESKREETRISFTYQAIIVFSLALISSAFVVKVILKYFLPNYYSSYKIVFILFAAQAIQIVIKSIFVNLYKVKKEQRKYFRGIIITIVSGFVFNIICFNIYRDELSFAIGTLLSAILWFIVCLHDFNELKNIPKYNLVLFIGIISFLVCGFCLNTIIGFFIYIALFVILTTIFMPNVYTKIWTEFKSIVDKIKQ